jgi:hypothetical protein
MSSPLNASPHILSPPKISSAPWAKTSVRPTALRSIIAGQWIHNDAVHAATGPFGAIQMGRPVAVEIEGGGKPACVAEAVSLFYRA